MMMPNNYWQENIDLRYLLRHFMSIKTSQIKNPSFMLNEYVVIIIFINLYLRNFTLNYIFEFNNTKIINFNNYN